MRDWPRLVRRDAMTRLERFQSAMSVPTVGRMAEPENPLGVLFRGRSVETPPEVRGMPRAAVPRLLSREYVELAKGAQVNAPQHSDASPSPINGRQTPWSLEATNGGESDPRAHQQCGPQNYAGEPK